MTRFKNLELDIAGDEVTLPETADDAGQGLGRPLSYLQIPISEVRKNSEDLALMLEWFEAVGYDVDIAGDAKHYGVKPTTLGDVGFDAEEVGGTSALRRLSVYGV